MIKPSFIKTKLNIKERIIDILWYNSVIRFLRKFGRFIKREIRWTSILWNQEGRKCIHNPNLLDSRG